MATDLVFPQGNEEKLVEMARKLGFTKLILCYRLIDPHLKSRADEAQRLSAGDLEVAFAIYIESQADVSRAQRFTREIVARGQPGAYEDRRVRYVMNFESGSRPDFVHHRNSGLNQVFISAVLRTGKTMLVNVNQLLTGEQHVILGRMMQNNRFFRKYKPSVLVVSGASEALDMRAPKDLENLLRL